MVFRATGPRLKLGRIFRAQFDAATYLDLNRLPELFCGFPRFASRGPTLYPVACAPQAWAAGTFFALLQASLGIEQDPWRKEIRFRTPTLPNFLDEVVVNGLAAGSGCVDVVIRRHGTRTSLEVLRAEGNINVKTELEDYAAAARLTRRLLAVRPGSYKSKTRRNVRRVSAHGAPLGGSGEGQEQRGVSGRENAAAESRSQFV